ncbi:MAG: GWxTD domain-containing protein [Ignavibacteria bacterium]|nr:GWxTD domain-containing protein [Ignavibacteria bacterium]
MLKILRPALFLFLIVSSIHSQDNLTFDFDYAIFRDESSKVFLEFYYSFTADELLFKKEAAGYEAGGKLELEVVNKSLAKTVVLKDFRIPVTLNDTSGANKDFKLTGQLNILLDPGTYVIKMKASDFNNPSKSRSAEEEVLLKPFVSNELNLSTIQLGTAIVKSADENNIFYKNTLEVTPNPSGLFGKNLSKLYYYLELYGLSKEKLGDNYTVAFTIANSDGSEIKNTSKKYEVKSESKVEYGSIDVSELGSNKYLLFVKLMDSKDAELFRSFKYFYIFNDDVNSNNQSLTDIENEYLLSEYPKMAEKQVDDEFKKAIYLMSDKQKEQYEALSDLDQKRMYMFKYWKGIAPYIPKKEYFSRIDFANKNFKSDFREGWKTDRGRVYAIYGKYSEIERFPYEGSTRAYEIWTYNNIQGGAIFVFIDNSSGYGDYILAHSTAQNEQRDDDWKERLNIR